MRRLLSTTLLGGLALLATPAWAQPARDPVAAEATFAAGLALLDKGDWAGACPKFRASMELEPSVGAQINVARCAEHDDKLATAWAEFQKVRSLNANNPNVARRQEVEAFVASAVAKLEPRLPKLSVRITSAPPGLKVTRDGVPLPAGALGDAIPVDPGPHELVVEAPGYRTEKRSVTLGEAQKVELTFTLVAAPGEVPGGPGGAGPAGPAAPEGGSNVPSPTVQPSWPGSQASPAGSPQVILGLVVGGLGLATIGGGFGVMLAASSKKDDMLDVEECELDGEALRCATQEARLEAQALRDDGTTLNTVGGVLFGVGGAAVATGAVLLIMGATSSDEPSERAAWSVTPLVGPGFVGVEGLW